ncbi:MAG TPA: AraC family transcriptional regulator ligand-binding domain-containing protein, partial [Polyangiales bacterium]
LLAATVQRFGDPLLGLKAGERWEPGDFDALEYASRSCATLRDAIYCGGRYMYLMHGAQEAVLIEENDRATLELRISDSVVQLPAANDFVLTSVVMYGRRYTGTTGGLKEVHFRHAEPTSVSDYDRIFMGAEIHMNARNNALVFHRGHLDTPMALAHAGLQAAFDLHASMMLERLKRAEGIAGRVRHMLVEQLRAGDVSMTTVARQLAMSVATLRRRLSDEGTSHSDLLDDVRRELAEKYLADMSLAISEVAFLLGFSHVTAFYKAFRRWSQGTTPAEFRAQTQRR